MSELQKLKPVYDLKESAYWLRLINETNSLGNAEKAKDLIQELTKLKKISWLSIKPKSPIVCVIH